MAKKPSTPKKKVRIPSTPASPAAGKPSGPPSNTEAGSKSTTSKTAAPNQTKHTKPETQPAVTAEAATSTTPSKVSAATQTAPQPASAKPAAAADKPLEPAAKTSPATPKSEPAAQKTEPKPASTAPKATEKTEPVPATAQKPAAPAIKPEQTEATESVKQTPPATSQTEQKPSQAIEPQKTAAKVEADSPSEEAPPKKTEPQPATAPKLAETSEKPTEATQKTEQTEEPAAEPAPKARTRDLEAEQLSLMPKEAESVHIEEPVPDETEHHEHRPELFIVHISPEMAPVAKVGGLADVVFGITHELAIRGNHVEIILPKYDNLRYDHIYGMHEVFNDLWVPWYDGAIHCTVYFSFVHDRKCFFIEPHSGDNFFNRGSIYGFPDDIMRFAFFSRAALEFLWKSGKHPDIIHCHDWQTALVPVLLYEIYQQMGMAHPRVCFTIHNYKHQGVTGMEMLRATGLHNPDRYFDYDRLRDNNNHHALNLLKGGIVYSNFITTVSPRYAMETKDQGQGFGLEPTLHTHQMKYGGVLNGIDYNVWNPEVDHLIPVRYSAENIDAKYDNKRALRHRLMLADNEKPIVAFIGRLDPQKGLELVRHAIFQSLEKSAQVVLLGSSPDPVINGDFWNLKHMLNESPDCHLEIGYDEELSHLIYAGADIMLVPSQFEPCGLTQLISLRYGTIPVVRAVGGLADTVFDKDHSHRPLHERNGYVFENYDHAGLESALIRAIDCYYQYPEHFRDLIRNAMRTDYSWNIPGQDYMNIYDYIRSK